MKCLAWDTSSKEGLIVAIEWNELIKYSSPVLVGELRLDLHKSHSETLLVGIDQLLRQVRWSKDEVGALGVGIGPGGFTGLRIGVGTAKAWAWTKNIPLVGFSSLAFLARSMVVPLQAQGRGGASTLLIAASDACQGEVYALIGSPQAVKDCVAMADGDNPGIWKRGVSEEVHLIPQFQKEIHRRWKKRLSNKKGMDAWVGIGEAFEKNTDLAGVLPAKNRIRPEIQHVRSGSVMAQMVWEAYQMGLGRDPSHVRLRYLRASDAEVKLKAGKLKVNALR